MPTDEPEPSSDGQTHHHQIDPSGGEVNTSLLELVASKEGCRMDELPPFWTRVDSLVEDLFSDPPSKDAQAQVEFTYTGYRITVDQSGSVTLLKVGDVPATDQ